MNIYALRVHDEWTEKISDSLHNGEGRFGWSYVETADLRRLRDRFQESGWDNLNKAEQDCYNGQEFLLDLEPDDYVVYINVPQYGRCMLAKVTSEYFFHWEFDDFNHRFSVDRDSVYEFDRNDVMVAPALSARLKLQGRKWRIYAESEFNELLESLRQEVAPRPSTSEDNLLRLKKEIREEIRGNLKSITEDSGKPVSLLIGEDLAAFILRHAPDLLLKKRQRQYL